MKAESGKRKAETRRMPQGVFGVSPTPNEAPGAGTPLQRAAKGQIFEGQTPPKGEKHPIDFNDKLAARIAQSKFDLPKFDSFADFLAREAKVLGRDGSVHKFSTEGREPIKLVVEWVDKILANCLDGQEVEIDGVRFAPGRLKNGSVAVGGGAQWGKTILELNLIGYCTAIKFISAGNYLPDGPKVKEIVAQKLRPNVLDVYPWMAQMIQVGKTENASGKTVNREDSYQVSDGNRKAFANFCGMHKPPTSISIGIALLDEVDDIPDRNIGYVSARMTQSPLALTMFIGTQRVAGAGQNARLKASSFHVKMVPCPKCAKEWNLEEEFPRCIRINKAESGKRKAENPIITPEMGHQRDAEYYCACPECGAELDRSSGRYVAKHPERVAQARLGVRVSQLNISAISLQEIVGAWYAAFEDPSGEAMVAFYCDRIAIPNAGAAQPIVQTVLDTCRVLGMGESAEAAQPYSMSLSRASAPRFAGMDMGPRCWLWVDEVPSPLVTGCVWAEMIASGSVPARLATLMDAMGIACVFLDAGGEPDLTKRVVLALNGLDSYTPPVMPRNDLLKSRLSNLGVGLTWDGSQAKWRGLRAAAVLFVAGEAKGIEQTIGFTQDGKIYPLIKCNRGESIQTAVNDFLTPAAGVIEMIDTGAEKKAVRSLPRARLPQTYLGPGASQSIVDGHLLNLRKERDPRTGEEDWIEGVENHLGLAKTYARLASMVGAHKQLARLSFSAGDDVDEAFDSRRYVL